MSTGKHYREKKRSSIRKKILKIILSIFIILILVMGFLLYGPYSGLRDWIITVGMTSMTHQWIPKLLYSDKIMKINRFGFSQERNIVITENAIFNFKKKGK